jgi:hypothetical protein
MTTISDMQKSMLKYTGAKMAMQWRSPDLSVLFAL